MRTKLAVILHADVVSSTARVQRDERVAQGRMIRAFGALAHWTRADNVASRTTHVRLFGGCVWLVWQRKFVDLHVLYVGGRYAVAASATCESRDCAAIA